MPSDVFLSYSHLDNNSPKGWVASLRDGLNATIAASNPALDVRIFFDEADIRESEGFQDRIKRELKETRVLLCVSSPAYNSSQYCVDELDFFVKARRRAQPPIVHVQKKRMKSISLLEPFQISIGHSFHDETNGREWPPGDPNFERALQPLAEEVVGLVEARRAPRQRVLVLSSADRDEECLRLANDLAASDLEVFPSPATPLPVSSRDQVEQVKLWAKQVDFSVLLPGREHSKLVETAFGELEQKWTTKPRRCLVGSPSEDTIRGMDGKQSVFWTRIESSGEAFDFCERTEQLRPETVRLLDALTDAARRTPTLLLYYRKGLRAAADDLRAEIRSLFAAQAPGSNLKAVRLLDPYGDGDGTELGTQTAGLDQARRAAHGALIIAEQSENMAQLLVNDLKGDFSAKLLGIYASDPLVKVPPTLTREYPFLQPNGSGVALPAGALLVTLPEFLDRIRERASQ